MPPSRLDRLAKAYGVAINYREQSGRVRHMPDTTKRWALAALGVDSQKGDLAQLLADAPHPSSTPAAPAALCAFAPDWLKKGRGWGISCQLYALRSARNWGIGDLEDLARLAEIVAGAGGDFVGIGPLHALFLSDPGLISPYAPSTREFLNPLYIAPDCLPGGAKYARQHEAGLAALRTKKLVDYVAVARTKFSVLHKIFEDFEASKSRNGISRRADFEQYILNGGTALKHYCLFEALTEHFRKRRTGTSWRKWPAEYQVPESPECARFAVQAAPRLRYYAWLQFIADEQLKSAQARARAAGMRIGLYLDIAVGVSPDGETAWTAGDALVADARLGSPPDPFNAEGQNWGLVPLSPQQLRETQGGAFRAVLSSSMCHAGAIRIDHALGLWRQFWIPNKRKVGAGTYVRYPFDTLTKAVVEKSRAFGALVIGEDLGTVPRGFSEALNAAGIFSYRVLYFERGKKGAFLAPADYPPHALACISTHDLATLAGWWEGADIDLRTKHGRTPASAVRHQHQERHDEKQALVKALGKESLLPPNGNAWRLDRPMPPDMLVAVHRYLARTRSVLCAVQLEDALGMRAQANLPGTVNEHPNWRLRVPVPLEKLAKHSMFRAVTSAMNEEGRAR